LLCNDAFGVEITELTMVHLVNPHLHVTTQVIHIRFILRISAAFIGFNHVLSH